MTPSAFRFRAGWLTTSRIVGALIVGVAIGATINATTSFLVAWVRTALAAIAAVIVIIAGAYSWGRSIARLATLNDERRIARTTAAIIAPGIVIIGLILSTLEPVLVARGALIGMSIHAVYALVFVAATLIIAGLGGFALGIGARDIALAGRLSAASGFAAAAAFFVVSVVMYALGWRVGAPDAGRRATMLVVTALGATAAALSAGAAIGAVLAGPRGTKNFTQASSD